MSQSIQCPLCGRGDQKPSRHHLVPKARGGREMAAICGDCHRQIHALFPLRALEKELNTVEKLRESPPMQAYIQWASRQGGGRIQVRASRSKKGK